MVSPAWIRYLLVFFALILARETKCSVTSQIDDIVRTGLACHYTPGLSLAVVKDGQVVQSKGYGVADMATGRLVTNTTLFGIASLTKAFTATLLAKILDSRNMKISTNLYKIIGRNRFNNTLRSTYATVEDLLSHRMGIPRHSYIRLSRDLTREDLVRRVKFLKNKGGFRDSFYYSDLMYGILTYIIEQLSGGRLWEDQITSELFDPLDMTSSTFSTRANIRHLNGAIPYVFENGTLEEASMDFIRHWALIGGSGSILSNAEDMAKWMLFHLSGGKSPSGHTVVKKSVLDDTYRFRNPLDYNSDISRYFTRPAVPATTSNDAYALGWKRGYYRGLPIMQHSGTTFGYRSLITLFPDENLGIFTAMTGSDQHYWLRTTLHNYISDLYLGETPWLNTTTICSFPSPWHANTRRRRRRGPRGQPRSAARPIHQYVGVYRNEAYGNIDVSIGADHHLAAVFGIATWRLEPKSGDSFKAVWVGPPPRRDFTFTFLVSGPHVHALTVPKFEKDDPPVFNRIQVPSVVVG